MDALQGFFGDLKKEAVCVYCHMSTSHVLIG